jgi:outer membrane protein TolC
MKPSVTPLPAAGFACRTLLPLLAALIGCVGQRGQEVAETDLAHYVQMAREPVCTDAELMGHSVLASPQVPLTVEDTPREYWDLTLQEAARLALGNSRVLRDLGGALLRGAGTLATIHDPAIQETDPNFGPEAALSDFDAQFSTQVVIEKNDRALNNLFLGGGTQLFQQDLAVVPFELQKQAVTGSRFFLRNYIDYDANNALGNRFPHAWNWNVEAEIRQPLLQGAGVEFNRIAGPGGRPGSAHGVLIARLNSEISLADFESGLRDFLANVENAYWDLYFAYRDLDAKLAARDASLAIWQRIRTLSEARRRGGEAENEARAREQYYRFQAEVQESLSGRSLEPTRTFNGSTGGTFRGTAGVQVAERRLRLLMGVDQSDGRLIRPIEEPTTAPVVFDWQGLTAEALFRRPELQRQRRLVKRRELELIASKNYLRPRLDVLGRYRWRGFGRDLMDGANDADEFDNAWANLLEGNYQEWNLGMELKFPIGFRQAHLGVRNAQLRLARERDILSELERQILHGVADAYADVKRAYALAQTNYERRVAAQQQLDALRLKDEQGRELDWGQLLEAWRRTADAESQLHRSLVEYVVAVKNVHFEKGSLLDYNEIYLADEECPPRSAAAAYRACRAHAALVDYTLSSHAAAQ